MAGVEGSSSRQLPDHESVEMLGVALAVSPSCSPFLVFRALSPCLQCFRPPFLPTGKNYLGLCSAPYSTHEKCCLSAFSPLWIISGSVAPSLVSAGASVSPFRMECRGCSSLFYISPASKQCTSPTGSLNNQCMSAALSSLPAPSSSCGLPLVKRERSWSASAQSSTLLSLCRQKSCQCYWAPAAPLWVGGAACSTSEVGTCYPSNTTLCRLLNRSGMIARLGFKPAPELHE